MAKQLMAEPVKGSVPLWFIKKLGRKYPMPSSGWGHKRILDETLAKYGLPGDWYDHSGTSKLPDGRTCYVAEPYFWDESDKQAKIDQFVTLCESLGLETAVSMDSWHNPGQTVRLMAFEP